jgi:hypothetical protein
MSLILRSLFLEEYSSVIMEMASQVLLECEQLQVGNAVQPEQCYGSLNSVDKPSIEVADL